MDLFYIVYNCTFEGILKIIFQHYLLTYCFILFVDIQCFTCYVELLLYEAMDTLPEGGIIHSVLEKGVYQHQICLYTSAQYFCVRCRFWNSTRLVVLPQFLFMLLQDHHL